MTEMNIEQIVKSVIQNDILPPSEDYCAYDYGVKASQGLPSSEATSLVAESIKCLPHTLAESFLEGVLDTVEIPNLETILLAALPNSREVSSGGLVANLLLDRCQLGPQHLAIKLLSELHSTTNHDAQNRLAFAIWVLPRHSNSGPESSPESMSRLQTINEVADGLLSDSNLSTYARDILVSCKKNKWKPHGCDNSHAAE